MPFEFDPTATAPSADKYSFEGHVDFYGHSAAADGWFFGGWLAHPWPAGNRPEHVAARFEGANLTEHTLTTFYHRADVARRGIGFVFFLSGPATDAGALLRLSIAFTEHEYDMQPTAGVLVLSESGLLAELYGILAGGEDGSQRAKMFALLKRGSEPEATGGFVDAYGTHATAGGWLFSGWVARGWEQRQQPTRVVACFEQGDIGGDAIAVLHARPDLEGDAEGCVCFLHGPTAKLGALCSVTFEAAGRVHTMLPGAAMQRVREPDLARRLIPLLTQATPGPAQDHLLALLARQPYAGQDTLDALGDPVFVEIDEAIVCEPDGLVLIGWRLARPDTIHEIRVRCGTASAILDLSKAIAVERPDVLAALGARHGFDDARCGFVAFVPHSIQPGASCHLEVETTRREIGFRTVPRPKLSDMPAIRRILDGLDTRYADLPLAFDAVVGPAVQMLNRGRLKRRLGPVVVEYGEVPKAPTYSVIVPLYGRLDYVEYQMALFSAHPPMQGVEFIYVLDDPPRRREAQALFASAHARFGIPFRALLLERNVGFAPANNIALAHAAGECVAFLNSDVFPGTPDWLERLGARLAADPALGVVGPVLLFEDGSIQHQGMDFVRLREFGDWYFPRHVGKGLRGGGGGGLAPCLSITGACMVMRRDLARTVGGFDETYVIGDFEDSDLCLKLNVLGYGSAVDRDVRLYHLERKSQASSALAWRMNLTLYNAWQHERRWSTTIDARQDMHAQIA